MAEHNAGKIKLVQAVLERIYSDYRAVRTTNFRKAVGYRKEIYDLHKLLERLGVPSRDILDSYLTAMEHQPKGK